MKKSRLLGAVCACLLFTSSITSAELVEIDLVSPGDALITRDTETALDWLDLTQTIGRSINEVLGGYGGYIDSGFRYATTDEVATLYSHAPIVTFNTSLNANWVGATNLLLLMGETGGSWNGTVYAEGFAGLGEPGVGLAYVPAVFRIDPGMSGSGLIPGAVANYDSTDGAYGAAGSYLVRVVPIPPALWLFGSGLLGLVGMARRKAK